MSKAPYRHSDGSNCYTKNCSRGHKTSVDTAVASGDVNAYIDARQSEPQKVPDFTQMFNDAINEEQVTLASIDDALENMRFYDQYMIDRGLYTDDDELADERESNEIEIHHSLEVIIMEYGLLNDENKALVRSKLTPRDKEVFKNFYGELDLPVPKEFS